MIINEIKICYRKYKKTNDFDHIKDIFRLLHYKLVGGVSSSRKLLTKVVEKL